MSAEAYFVDRKFYSPVRVGNANLQPINRTLPTFKGSDAAYWLDTMFESKKEVSILDLGCGNGSSLAEIRSRYGTRANLFGITKEIYDPLQIERSRVHLFDMRELPTRFSSIYFDFIYSAHALQYVHQNIVDTSRMVWDRLSSNGMAFLHRADLMSAYTSFQASQRARLYRTDAIELHACVLQLRNDGLIDIDKVSMRRPSADSSFRDYSNFDL